MPSFHELKASAPGKPVEAEASSTPKQEGYFGWQVTRRINQPPAEIPTASPTDITPNRILSAIRGEDRLPSRQHPVNPRGQSERALSEWELLKQAREERRKEAKARRGNVNGTK